MKNLIWIAVSVIGLMVACKKNETAGIPVVTTTTPASITSNAAQTGGDITSNGHSTISQSGVCWAFQNPPTLSDSVVLSNSTATGSFTVSLTNLNANTVYYVRAFVTNGVGTAYGSVDSFTTSAGVPTLSTAAISNNDALSAQTGGSITNNGGATVTASGICWSTSANPTISNSKTVGTTTSGSFADTLTNLTLGSTYYVRAYATNSYGTGYGSQISFTVSSNGTVSDIDGNAYPTVTIGSQTWMASDLRVTHYQNGDSLFNAFFNTTFNWSSPTGGAYTYPNGDTANRAVYGLLYNPEAVNDPRNVAPAGWHVATVADWETLEFFEGMAASDTGTISLTAVGNLSPILSVGGSSNLNLQFPGNFGGTSYGLFGVTGYYWTADSANSVANYYRAVFAPSSASYPGVRQTYNQFGMAIRCVKD